MVYTLVPRGPCSPPPHFPRPKSLLNVIYKRGLSGFVPSDLWDPDWFPLRSLFVPTVTVHRSPTPERSGTPSYGGCGRGRGSRVPRLSDTDPTHTGVGLWVVALGKPFTTRNRPSVCRGCHRHLSVYQDQGSVRTEGGDVSDPLPGS